MQKKQQLNQKDISCKEMKRFLSLQTSHPKLQKGVTLLEMLVAVAVFSITIGAVSGIFISAIQMQRKVLASQELLDQTSFALEYMGRALRLARRDTDGSCITVDYNYENPTPGDTSSIAFLDYNGVCTEYFLDTSTGHGQLMKSEGANLSALTSSELDITSLKFIISGESVTDDLQPKVTIFLEILGREAIGGRPKTQIQTSVSQRALDALH